jgi:hypothetical protein
MIDPPQESTELPIACTLGAGDFETRLAEIRAIGRRNLLRVRRVSNGPVVLSFRRDSETEAELQRIVAAEAECCAFLELRITRGEELELTIDGPEDARPVIEELVDAFAAEATS